MADAAGGANEPPLWVGFDRRRRDVEPACFQEVPMKFTRCSPARGALVVFLVGASSVSAQEQEISCDDVPRAVRAAFEKAYPKAAVNACAEEVEAGETVYEIASKEGGTGRDVLFRADGGLILVEETVALGDVPDPVRQALRNGYPDGEVTLAEKIMRDATVLYEFRVEDRGGLEEIVFDGSGKEVEHKSGEEVEQ
jgi:hypothetical protein